jgi:hypothetical protein
MSTSKLPKLNPTILDAFDAIANKFYSDGSINEGRSFKHFNCFLQELPICDNTWDASLPGILVWESEQKLLLISFLAILSDRELLELFSIDTSLGEAK